MPPIGKREWRRDEKMIKPRGRAYAYWHRDRSWYEPGGSYRPKREGRSFPVPARPGEWDHLDHTDRHDVLIMEYWDEVDRCLFEQENELGEVHP